ncbi:ABC transporter ATP-binding protein [Enterococcus sp. LJL98]
MMLTLKNVTKQYNNREVLKNISFEFNPGIYGLLGANGAGKTTLFHIICGVISQDKGDILFNNKDTKKKREAFLANLGFLPQNFTYYPDFSGLDFLLYISSLKGVDKKKSKDKCIELLNLVGLDQEKNIKIKKYSGGMKQRLGIAQAMINNPKVLILDEPTVGLDPKERVRFRNLISSLSDEKIVILSTHIVSDIEYIADEILVLKKGILENTGQAEDLVKTIENKVWECSISTKNVDYYLSKYTVSNQKHEHDNTILRIISEEQPIEEAIKVEPTLEDLYLYYFREDVK